MVVKTRKDRREDFYDSLMSVILPAFLAMLLVVILIHLLITALWQTQIQVEVGRCYRTSLAGPVDSATSSADIKLVPIRCPEA